MGQTPIQSEPIDFIGLPYSPALMLDARLSAVITDDPEFRPACEWGFTVFFEEVENEEFEACTMEAVKAAIRENMRDDIDPFFGGVPLVNRVGVSLGWLSALALAQYQEAKEGLQELMALLERS